MTRLVYNAISDQVKVYLTQKVILRFAYSDNTFIIPKTIVNEIVNISHER